MLFRLAIYNKSGKMSDDDNAGYYPTSRQQAREYNVITPGRVPAPVGHTPRLTCRRCNAVFTANMAAATRVGNEYDDYTVKCPTRGCGNTITFN